MRNKKHILPLVALVAASFIGCTTQNDGDVMFSDTELAIIKTLIYTDAPDDPTNAYDLSTAAATLGQKFFWDTNFSGEIKIIGNRTSAFAVNTERKIACVTCHVPSFGWADNTTKPNDVSLGVNFTNRNAPTVLNTAKNTYSLWDGASDSLWGVMRPAIEGNPHGFGRLAVAYVICNSGTYKTEYEAIFGSADTTGGSTICSNMPATGGWISLAAGSRVYGTGTDAIFTSLSSTLQGQVNRIFANYGKAIAAYERLLVSKNSAFDQWANGNEGALTVSQKRGLKVFIGKGNCVRCHSGSNFADNSFHNLGVPQVGGYSGSNDQGRYDGITVLKTGSNSPFNTTTSLDDSGTVTDRVTGLSASSSDIGKFKTPTLRSVSQTAPYFHNGTFNSLWDVVNFYNFAGNAGNFPGTKDTVLTTRHMTNEEMEDLMNFLNALDGETLSTSLTTSPTLPTQVTWP